MLPENIFAKIDSNYIFLMFYVGNLCPVIEGYYFLYNVFSFFLWGGGGMVVAVLSSSFKGQMLLFNKF